MIIKVELGREYYIPIYFQQFDEGAVQQFQILREGVPFNLAGYSVRMKAIKPDKTKIYNDMIIDNATSGLSTLKLTTQMLLVAGLMELQIEIRKSGIVFSTVILNALIKKSIDPTGLVQSSNEFTALDIALDKVDEWNAYFQENSGKIEEKYTPRLNKAEQDILDFKSQLEDNAMQTISTDASLTKLNSVLDGNLIVDRVQGRTLVNIITKDTSNDIVIDKSVNSNERFTKYALAHNIISSKCTLIVNVTQVNASVGLRVAIGFTDGTTSYYTITKEPKLVAIDLSTIWSKDISSIGLYIEDNDFNANQRAVYNRLMLLEGNYTQNPPSYFTGMKSVAEDNQKKIEISTCGKNLFDGVWEVGDIAFDTGNNTTASNNCIRFKNYIKVIPGSTITMTKVSAENTKIRLYDSNKVYIGTAGFPGVSLLTYTYKLPETVFYVRFVQEKMSDLSTLFQIEYGDNATPYEPYKEDESEISLLEPLREFDYICKDRVHRKTFIKEISELDNIGVQSTNSNGIVNYSMTLKNAKGKRMICNMLKQQVTVIGDTTDEGFLGIPNELFIRLKCTTLGCQPTDDDIVKLQKLKTWLQTKKSEGNPLTIVYETATETIEPLNESLILSSFKDGYFGINAGAINPVVSLRFPTNIGERVTGVEESTIYLRNRYYESLKVQLQLLAKNIELETNKQNKTDSTLTTASKEVVAAINENKAAIETLKTNKEEILVKEIGENDCYIKYKDGRIYQSGVVLCDTNNEIYIKFKHPFTTKCLFANGISIWQTGCEGTGATNLVTIPSTTTLTFVNPGNKRKLMWEAFGI